jgi:hypothetical protein
MLIDHAVLQCSSSWPTSPLSSIPRPFDRVTLHISPYANGELLARSWLVRSAFQILCDLSDTRVAPSHVVSEILNQSVCKESIAA